MSVMFERLGCGPMRLASGFLCVLLSGSAWGVTADSAAEGQYFRLKTASAVSYGARGKFTVKQLPAGIYLCGNRLFGDPNDGVVKSCKTTGFLEALACYPAQMGGAGSRAAWGVSLSPVQAWAGWWCDGRLQVVACRAEGCKPDAARAVLASVSDIMNTQVKAFRTEEIDSVALKAVWGAHLAEIAAMKGVH